MYMHQESLSFHIQRIQLNDQLLEITKAFGNNQEITWMDLKIYN